MFARGYKADMPITLSNVLFWHKADITIVLIHVRFPG